MKRIKVLLFLSFISVVFFFIGYSMQEDLEIVDVYLEGEKYTFRDGNGYKQNAVLIDGVPYLPLNEESLFFDYSVVRNGDKILLVGQEYPNYVDISTETLEGSLFTNENFFNYDLTIFFNWTTWCPDCKAFLSDFNGYQSKLEEQNIQFIGLPIFEGPIDKGKIDDILNDLNIEFTNLVVTDEMKEQLQSNISSIPSVVIVDSKGKIVYKNEKIDLLFENIFEDIENLDLCNVC